MSLNGSKRRQDRSLRVVGGAKNRTSQTLKREIKHEIKAEMLRELEVKIFDLNVSAANVGSGSTLNVLSSPAQGVGRSQRTGDSITLHSLNVTYAIVQANTDIYSDTRIIIFQWFPNTSLSSPVLADILENTGAIGLYSQYAWDTRDQYRIMYDRLHSQAGLATAPTATTNVSVFNRKVGVPRKNIDFTTGVTSGSNTLWTLWISDSAIAPFPLLNFTSRLKFTDG